MSQKTRLLFKFYRSYFDVACELSDKDRLAFYDAIMQRQFLGIEPNLKGVSKLAYVSQKHNIDAQVKGWEDYFKTQIVDTNAMIPPMIHPMIPPMIQEEEKEKEKEEEKQQITNTIYSFDEFWETYNKKTGRVNCERIYARLKDKDYAKIKETLPIYLASVKDKQYLKNPQTYLNGKCWEDEIFQEAKTTEPTPSVPYEGFNPLSIDLSKLKPLR